ncbi:MAG: DUF3487 family protein [Flavobacteriales bacterium]|jgi:conjugative transfer region protein (TIGR03750 family)|nr:DUF3487 family protein [Flavobacteriales bacterium]
MSSNEFTDDFVPTFLNQEPVVILGLTDSEVMTSGLISILLSLVLAVASGLLAASFMVGLVVLISLFIGFLIGCSFMFRYFKRDKPRGYFGALVKTRLGIGGKSYYLRDEPLIIGRTNKRVVVYE